MKRFRKSLADGNFKSFLNTPHGGARGLQEALGSIFVGQRFGLNPPEGQGVDGLSPQGGRLCDKIYMWTCWFSCELLGSVLRTSPEPLYLELWAGLFSHPLVVRTKPASRTPRFMVNGLPVELPLKKSK